jgi:putative Ca2+/H+ antiporter (TMEM165/GDT1 family)
MTTITNDSRKEIALQTRVVGRRSSGFRRISKQPSSLLRSILVLCLACLLVLNGSDSGRNALLVSAAEEDTAAGGADAGDGPPKGLFERLDLNHDKVLSESEYKSGWPLIAKEVSGGFGSWLPANNGGFMKGFTSGVAMILATEIGDKTFFIAAVLSMRQQRSAVFLGAVLSLYVMTVLSSVMGLVLPQLMPVKYTHILGGLLFLYFGFKLLFDAKGMDSSQVSEELEEVEEELLHPKKDERDEESQALKTSNSIRKGFSEIAIQSFTLTFLAEWGDRSQIATIALSAAKNPYGVTLGGCIGHTMCTGMAVLGGRMLAARISEKTVSIFGGIIFLAFGIHSVFFES